MRVPADVVRQLLLRAGYVKTWDHPHEGGVREQWSLLREHWLSPRMFYIVDETVDEEVAKYLRRQLEEEDLLGPQEGA